MYLLHLYWSIVLKDHLEQKGPMVTFYLNTVGEGWLRLNQYPFKTDDGENLKKAERVFLLYVTNLAFFLY